MKKFLTFLGWPLLILPTLVLHVGFLLNEAAVFANNGQMPVEWSQCQALMNSQEQPDPVHVCATPKTHLRIFGDFFVSDAGISSIGDDLMQTGDAMFPANLVVWGLLGLGCAIQKKKFYLE